MYLSGKTTWFIAQKFDPQNNVIEPFYKTKLSGFEDYSVTEDTVMR